MVSGHHACGGGRGAAANISDAQFLGCSAPVKRQQFPGSLSSEGQVSAQTNNLGRNPCCSGIQQGNAGIWIPTVWLQQVTGGGRVQSWLTPSSESAEQVAQQVLFLNFFRGFTVMFQWLLSCATSWQHLHCVPAE